MMFSSSLPVHGFTIRSVRREFVRSGNAFGRKEVDLFSRRHLLNNRALFMGLSPSTPVTFLSTLLLHRLSVSMTADGPQKRRCTSCQTLESRRHCSSPARPAASSAHPSGLSSSLPASSSSCEARPCSSPSTSKVLEETIIPLIPYRFTTISQIARGIPGAVMEALHEQEEGGLKQFLERRPKLFEVTRVAGVLRAKLRHQLKGNESSSAAARTCSSADHWASSIPVEPSSGRNRTKVGTKKVPEHVYKTYPRFCIPFSAMLLHHSSPPSEQSEPQNVVEPNASSFSIAIPSDSGQQDNAARLWSQLKEDAPFLRIIRLYNPEDNLEVQFARTFVNVLPEFAAGKLTEADQTYERYEVEPYEWFRIARVSPFTRTFLVVTPTVLQEASQLLPPNRDPVHVWASAPELFEITIGDGDQGELGMLCVRYILHPSYMATGENKTEEEIIRQLEELSGPTQRTKKKRRRLRRALQCLQEPLSFLDDRVWAHFIFDSLPESGSATAEKVVSMLPEAYKNCTPVQWRSTLQKFPMLFKVYDGPVDLVIQRADLPVMQMRPLQDITAEEILQEIYKAYPLRFHPVIGVTISQMLTKLPRSITQRLYTMENVELELLLPFQDKVEILRDHTFFIEQQGGPPVYSACGRLRVPFKSRPEMLLQVRGREDFLIGFRFVGEWQERLLEKFTKRCQKYDCDPETTSFLPIPV